MLFYIFVVFGSWTFIQSGAASLNTTTESQNTSPCPCSGQPEGIVIPHPVDCRAYYTCMGGFNVRHSKCPNRDQFFHPYIRSCVQRTTFVSFVPNFVPTKDICKITAVFPSPAMEDFDNCNITPDESAGDPNSDEIISIKNSNDVNGQGTTTIPTLDSILSLFPWMTSRSPEPEITTSGATTTTSPLTYTPSQLEIFGAALSTIPTTSPYFSRTESCKVAKIVVHHFPGPCKADITCESGLTMRINQCQSSLSLVQI